jgi:YVTN family beta-propeller protein
MRKDGLGRLLGTGVAAGAKGTQRCLIIVLVVVAVLFVALPARGQSGPPHLFVFNMGSDDVTIIDPATNRVLGTRPAGFKVKWLADHMRSFDGKLLWTYGLRTEKVGKDDVLKVDAVAFDPVDLRVVQRREVGRGPAHSVVVTPDGKHVIMNVAGDDVIALIDPATARVAHRLPVGRFPCDLHLSPDGRVAFFPERDQDTVSAVDVASRQVLTRVSFARGSKPHMLRVSPDGRYVWVQNAASNTNEILDSQTLQVVNSQPVGKVPTTNAWTPDGRHSWVLHEGDNQIIVMEAQPPFRQVKRIEVGPNPGNVSFRPDGRYAYVTVGGLNAVAVIDMKTLTVETMLPAGRTPFGIVLLDVRPRL